VGEYSVVAPPESGIAEELSVGEDVDDVEDFLTIGATRYDV